MKIQRPYELFAEYGNAGYHFDDVKCVCGYLLPAGNCRNDVPSSL